MSRLVNSKAQIEEIRQENQRLAFSASLGSNGFFGPDVTLVYKNVFIYLGDAYQQATGIQGHNTLSNNTPENGGNGLTLQLEKGDQVYIILRKSTWIWNSENVTVFSGFNICGHEVL
uniref:C1q domain-containing protein n=1 Tax=Cyprinus carpio TaxID=7962 RepID=A0A8C1ZAT8_CYPCA